MADLFWHKGAQFFDNNGEPLSAGTINVYDAGTLSTRTVYQDAGETTPWSQPITLNAAGRLTESIYIPSGDWKFALKDSAGSTIAAPDNIPGATAESGSSFAAVERPITTKASNYTVLVGDLGKLFVVDTTGGNVTLTLPAAALVSNGRGIDVLGVGTANGVIIDGAGAETINGSATLTLTGKGAFAQLVSDGSGSWSALGTPQTQPIGLINDYAGTTAPPGWLICNGQAVSRTTYALLFAVTSTAFGIGNGTTTFNVPDLTGRTTAGIDALASRISLTTRGSAGGSQTHILATSEIPSHSHTATVTDPGHAHSIAAVSALSPSIDSGGGAFGVNAGTTSAATTGIAVSVASAGGGGAHNNMQPTMAVLKIIYAGV